MELFNKIAVEYVAKDNYSSSRIARRNRILRSINSIHSENLGDVLEVGCGGGYSVDYLRGCFDSYHGIDYSSELIEHAKLKFSNLMCRFEVANIKNFNPDKKYDMILMIGVLHHLDDLAASLEKMVELLKPGAYLVANEPQSANKIIGACRKIRKKWDKKYSDEQIEMSFSSLTKSFQNAGLVEVKCFPQGILSTPFAEVVMGPQFITSPLSKLCCVADRIFESTFPEICKQISWNAVVSGMKPA
jgi:trans-aconitate methyltransferase